MKKKDNSKFNFHFILTMNDDSTMSDLMRTLGEVTNNPDGFCDIDTVFLKDAEFVTLVPVEIALTYEMRQELKKHSPETKFIVTKLTEAEALNLMKEYGYESIEVEHVDSTKEDKQYGDYPNVNYTINGKEVSAEEYAKYAQPILEKFFKLFS